jgi:AraC-like DNA-binding protein
VTLSPGSVIYLPKNSHHTVTAPLRSLEFFRINFTVVDLISSEETVFSKEPIVITHASPRKIIERAQELTAMTLRPYTDFKTMAALCEIIDFCISALNSNTKNGIDRALNYIEEHCMEDINLRELAAESYMSYSHLFRSFKQKFGVTPIEYKNSLRIEKAKKLLLDYDLSVGEIAERLGFEGACYFTRAFKSRVGFSPLAYRKAEIGTKY